MLVTHLGSRKSRTMDLCLMSHGSSMGGMARRCIGRTSRSLLGRRPVGNLSLTRILGNRQRGKRLCGRVAPPSRSFQAQDPRCNSMSRSVRREDTGFQTHDQNNLTLAELWCLATVRPRELLAIDHRNIHFPSNLRDRHHYFITAIPIISSTNLPRENLFQTDSLEFFPSSKNSLAILYFIYPIYSIPYKLIIHSTQCKSFSR